MRKTNLERAIDAAVADFTAEVIAVFRGLTVAELSALLGQKLTVEKPKRAQRRRGRPAKRARKRKINYPKCAHPGCTKNRWARGKGYCGEHYKALERGETGSASTEPPVVKASTATNARDNDLVPCVHRRRTSKPTSSPKNDRHALARAAIIAFVRANPDADAELISMKLGVPIQATRNYLQTLVAEGELIQAGDQGGRMSKPSVS